MADEDLTQEEQKLFKFFVKAFEQVVIPVLDGHEHEFKGINNKLSGIGTRMGGVENRMDNIENRLDRIENKLDKVAEKVTDHDNRIQKLEQPQVIS